MNDHAFEELSVGQEFERAYVITDGVYQHFLDAFQDVSPLHVDDTFAREHGFAGVVMHGAILNGFISHFVGVEVPGRRALIQSVSVEYRAPSYLGDRIVIRAKVAQKVDALRVMILSLSLHDATRDVLVAKGKVQIGFTS